MKVGLDGTVEKSTEVRKKRERVTERHREGVVRERGGDGVTGIGFGCGWRGGRLR